MMENWPPVSTLQNEDLMEEKLFVFPLLISLASPHLTFDGLFSVWSKVFG